MRVLIVDDIPDVAESLADLLRELGHEVHVSHSGKAALEEARAFGPEVVFCDLAMPHIDGLAVARGLRADPLLCDITLVAWTGFSEERYRVLAREAGFDAYLLKPADVSSFLEALELEGEWSGK